jgi:hypothetical protein
VAALNRVAATNALRARSTPNGCPLRDPKGLPAENVRTIRDDIKSPEQDFLRREELARKMAVPLLSLRTGREQRFNNLIKHQFATRRVLL